MTELQKLLRKDVKRLLCTVSILILVEETRTDTKSKMAKDS
jgi:hypothetical protein